MVFVCLLFFSCMYVGLFLFCCCLFVCFRCFFVVVVLFCLFFLGGGEVVMYSFLSKGKNLYSMFTSGMKRGRRERKHHFIVVAAVVVVAVASWLCTWNLCKQ